MTAAPAPHTTGKRRLSADNRREQILRSAADLFIERGFEGVSMADIAASLGTSRPTIYTYFPSTESVLDALLDERLEHLPARLRPLLCEVQATSFADVFRALLNERELLMLLNSGGGPHFRARRQAFLNAIEERLNLQQISKLRTETRGHLPQPMLIAVVLNLLSSVAYEQTVKEQWNPDELAALLEKFIVGGVDGVLG
ncbi:TetR/AcrR family transcriptional regulator [Deinococcus fonticola]|uniref:TetR/AcrR family transcriptional regulator n=1 Tax=Deinococcus fonticola TaxID=2528713 RepID=UPI001074C975|nr:TetR/AcrR family transcriptional regulator [Deinococcus fonticola]